MNSENRVVLTWRMSSGASGKIRIDGERVGERGRHLVKDIAACGDARLGAAAFEQPVMLQPRDAVGLNIQPEALTDVLDPDEIAALADIGEVGGGLNPDQCTRSFLW